jgi:hypothetical protein
MIYIVAHPHQSLLGLLRPAKLRLDMENPENVGRAAILVPPDTQQPRIDELQRTYPAAEVWECEGTLKLEPGDQVYDVTTAEGYLVEAA